MKHRIALLLASTLCATSAQAAAPTYSYVEASYLNSRATKQDEKGEGFRIGASVSLLHWLHFSGEFDRREVLREPATGAPADLDFTSLGFGAHTLRSDYQLYTVLSYEQKRSSPSLEGYGLRFGVRVPLQDFELEADYKYLDYGDDRLGQAMDDARYRFTASYRYSPDIALIGSYQTFEDFGLDEYTVGIRSYIRTQYDRPPRRR